MLTKAQQLALKDIYYRDWGHHPKPSYLDFRRSVTFPAFMGGSYLPDRCAMVFWLGMYLGIEPDGYVHS